VVRFFIEFVRNNQVIAWGLTGQQFFCVGLLLLVAAYYVVTQRRVAATRLV
jgi:prolipoprotein diacylglyceryltransferase